MTKRVVVLTGGVGGAKFVEGLVHAMPPQDVVAIVNTGDDFEHLGLAISPDLDTLLYTLSGLTDRQRGWGREDESWRCMEAVRALGGPDWFQLGDTDLATHLVRTMRLREGATLSEVTRDLRERLGIDAELIPMSDDAVGTIVYTDEGALSFQHYFVKRRCEPVVRGVSFAGSPVARPAPGVINAILSDRTAAVFLAPSNPWLSIDPILAVPEIREALRDCPAPVVAVSPLVGGKAVKGPTDKLMRELGLPVTDAAIADHYAGLIDAMLVDDRQAPATLSVPHAACDTLMSDRAAKARVARAALALAGSVGR